MAAVATIAITTKEGRTASAAARVPKGATLATVTFADVDLASMRDLSVELHYGLECSADEGVTWLRAFTTIAAHDATRLTHFRAGSGWTLFQRLQVNAGELVQAFLEANGKPVTFSAVLDLR